MNVDTKETENKHIAPWTLTSSIAICNDLAYTLIILDTKHSDENMQIPIIADNIVYEIAYARHEIILDCIKCLTITSNIKKTKLDCGYCAQDELVLCPECIKDWKCNKCGYVICNKCAIKCERIDCKNKKIICKCQQQTGLIQCAAISCQNKVCFDCYFRCSACNLKFCLDCWSATCYECWDSKICIRCNQDQYTSRKYEKCDGCDKDMCRICWENDNLIIPCIHCDQLLCNDCAAVDNHNCKPRKG